MFSLRSNAESTSAEMLPSRMGKRALPMTTSPLGCVTPNYFETFDEKNAGKIGKTGNVC